MGTRIDFRNIDRSARHQLFFALFDSLKEGSSFEFMNDHDPMPLYRQTQNLGIENLEWIYSEKGPDNWTVKITKIPMAGSKKEEGCCGICGGSGHAE